MIDGSMEEQRAYLPFSDMIGIFMIITTHECNALSRYKQLNLAKGVGMHAASMCFHQRAAPRLVVQSMRSVGQCTHLKLEEGTRPLSSYKRNYYNLAK